PGQGDPQRADLLRAGERQPRAVLRQRQPDAAGPAGRADALRGVLARPDGVRPPVAVLRLPGGPLRRAGAGQRAGDLVRDHPAAGRCPGAAAAPAAGAGLAEGGDRYAQALPQHVRYVDERVRLRDYPGPVRQLAVAGLGHEEPTLFLSNNVAGTARNVITRYAGRKRVEDGLGVAGNFFHPDWPGGAGRPEVAVGP